MLSRKERSDRRWKLMRDKLVSRLLASDKSLSTVDAARRADRMLRDQEYHANRAGIEKQYRDLLIGATAEELKAYERAKEMRIVLGFVNAGDERLWKKVGWWKSKEGTYHIHDANGKTHDPDEVLRVAGSHTDWNPPAPRGKQSPRAGREDFCRKCGGLLTIRTSSKDGSRFKACSNFPQCRHTESLKAAEKPAATKAVRARTIITERRAEELMRADPSMSRKTAIWHAQRQLRAEKRNAK